MLSRRTATMIPVVLAALALGGCALEPVPSAPPTATAQPTLQAPLACDELLSQEEVAAALTGDDGVVPTPVEAWYPHYSLTDYVLGFSGGLSCSWRTEVAAANPFGPTETTRWAYLTVRVLPGAAADWRASTGYGDGPPYDPAEYPDLFRNVAGVTALATCGDPGCLYSAPVGDSWVQLEVRAEGFTSSTSLWGGNAASLLDHMEPAAAAVFGTLSSATASQLEWPSIARPDREARCDGGLDGAGIGVALGLGPVVMESTLEHFAPEMWSFRDFVYDAAGLYTCRVPDHYQEYVTVGTELAPVVDAIASRPDTATAFEQVSLAGALPGERAVLACSASKSHCFLIFSVESTAYLVNSDIDAVAVAEAIIAQSR